MLWLLSILALSAEPPLDSLGAVRALSADAAAQGVPVDLQAVVTFADPVSREFFLQDADGQAVSMWYPTADATLPRGTRIRIRTTTSKGLFVSRLSDEHAQVEVLDAGALPPAPPLSFGQVAKGDHDCRFATIDGVIERIEDDDHRLVVHLVTAYGAVPAVVLNRSARPTLERWVGRLVRVRGVFATRLTERNQYQGLKLFTDGLDDFEALGPDAPPTPRSISRLLAWDPSSPNVLGQVRTRGIVTARRNATSAFVQEGDVGMVVSFVDPMEVLPGDALELTGFPQLRYGLLTLSSARVLRREPGPLPPPVPIRASEQSREPAYDLQLVELVGRVEDVRRRGEEIIVIVDVGGGQVEVRGLGTSAGPDVVPGATVRVVGVNQLFGTVYGNRWGVVALDRDASFEVIAAPPMLTPMVIIGGLIALLLIALAILVLARLDRTRLQLLVKARTKELDATNEQLRATEELRNQLVSLAAHDLFSPLTIITMTADRLLEAEAGPEVTASAHRLIRTSETMRALIDSRLRGPIERLEALAEEPFDLAAAARMALQALTPRLVHRQQLVRERIGVASGYGDRAAFESVVANLLDNASKYSPVASRIDLEVGQSGAQVFVRVRDHGPGVPATLRQSIFAGGSSGANLPKGESSTGQGLRLVQLVMMAMGGRLELEDTDTGASFVAWLPAAET